MAPSVEINEETDARLESLQAEIERDTGHSVTKGELLKRMLTRAMRGVDSLEVASGDDWDGLTGEEKERFFDGTAASEHPIDVDEIDRVLYEEELLAKFETPREASDSEAE